MKIGQYPAHDFFGDGSLYILDVPGHDIGHISGLVRVTPTTFVLLGGDVCHYGGSFRPSLYVPLPDEILPTPALARFRLPCPCTTFTNLHPHQDDESKSRTTPYYKVSSKDGSWNIDAAIAQTSINRLIEFDASEDVFVVIAHDTGLCDVVDFFPHGTLNDWKKKGWKAQMHWGFLNELPLEGGPLLPIAPGLVRDGNVVKALQS